MDKIAKYIVVVVDRGVTAEVNHFVSQEEAKRAFEEIARGHGYEPEEITALIITMFQYGKGQKIGTKKYMAIKTEVTTL